MEATVTSIEYIQKTKPESLVYDSCFSKYTVVKNKEDEIVKNEIPQNYPIHLLMLNNLLSKIENITPTKIQDVNYGIKEININLNDMMEQYIEEKKIVSNFIGNSNKYIDIKVSSVLLKILSIPSYKRSVEIVNSDSILISLFIENNHKAYINIYLNEDKKNYEAFFSFYQNDDALYNGLGKVDSVIDDIINICNSKSINLTYELPNRVTA